MSHPARRLFVGAALAAGAALAITGCSATTGGTAAGRAAAATGCAATGYSAAAATATVRCYLDALRAGDTGTACEQLSAHARADLLAAARDAEVQGLINVSTPSSGCATVATVIQRVLDSLTQGQRAELDHRLRTARIGAAHVAGSIATVQVHMPAGDTTRPTLVRGPVTWRIDSLLDAD